MHTALPLLALASLALAQADSDPQAVAGAFTANKIVPDVVPAFSPSVAVQLTFDDAGFQIPVNVGVLLTINRASPVLVRHERSRGTPAETAHQPAIALKSATSLEGKAFLVAMVRCVSAWACALAA